MGRAVITQQVSAATAYIRRNVDVVYVSGTAACTLVLPPAKGRATSIVVMCTADVLDGQVFAYPDDGLSGADPMGNTFATSFNRRYVFGEACQLTFAPVRVGAGYAWALTGWSGNPSNISVDSDSGMGGGPPPPP